MIVGTGLGPAPTAPASCITVPWLTSCGGTSVPVNGEAAPVSFASANNLTFEAPVNLSGSSETLQVTKQVNGQTLQSAVVTVPIAAVAPGSPFTVTAGNLPVVVTVGGQKARASNSP